MRSQPQQRDPSQACAYARTRLRMRAHTKHTCTPLCANYLSSAPIWLGCTACSPWARPVDIQAEINTSQLLGARDILVINSCVGLYNRDTPPSPTPAAPPERAVSFQISVCQAKAGSDQRRFSAKGAGGKPGEEKPSSQIPSLPRRAGRGFAPCLLCSTCSHNCKTTIAYFKVS